jgi:DNA-binding SARP family transcriptional activator
MFRLKFFGPGEAYYSDRPLFYYPRHQAYLLFCYLLLNPERLHSRDQLATMFWGEYPTQTSRKYLRNSLWKLRQLLEAVGAPVDRYFLINEDSVSFVGTAQVWSDVERFDTTLTAYQDQPGQSLTLEQASQLEQAIELYTDDLLVGVYEDWCLYERERLSLLYLRALSKLMSYHEENGTYEHGLSYGEKLLARDDTREKVHLQMMRLHWLSGDRNAALAQYKRCAQILRDQFGIAPMKETVTVYQQMLNNQFNLKRALQSTHLSSLKKGGDASTQPMAEHAVQKLEQLRQVIEEVNVEILKIEQILNASLLNPK